LADIFTFFRPQNMPYDVILGLKKMHLDLKILLKNVLLELNY